MCPPADEDKRPHGQNPPPYDPKLCPKPASRGILLGILCGRDNTNKRSFSGGRMKCGILTEERTPNHQFLNKEETTTDLTKQ